MSKIEIIKKDCLQCGLCRDTCPYDAIYMEGGFPVIDENKCTLCGACVNACPASAMIMQVNQQS